MGIAVDAEDGLIVPVVRDAHQLDLFGLVARTRDVTGRARNNTLQPEDVAGWHVHRDLARGPSVWTSSRRS